MSVVGTVVPALCIIGAIVNDLVVSNGLFGWVVRNVWTSRSRALSATCRLGAVLKLPGHRIDWIHLRYHKGHGPGHDDVGPGGPV